MTFRNFKTFFLSALIFCACEVRAENLDVTFNKLELMQLTTGASVENQIVRISRWLKERFNIQTRCDSGWIRSVSETECLLGIRRLAWEWIDKNAAKTPEPLTVTFLKSGSWIPLDSESRNAEVKIPFDARRDQMIRYIEGALASPEYQQRLEIINRIGDLSAQVEKLLSVHIEIAERVTNLHALDTLYRLLLLLKSDPSAVSAAKSEVFKLDNRFALPYEENFKLKESLDVAADTQAFKKYFSLSSRWQRVWHGHPNWPEPYFEIRQEIETAKAALAKYAGTIRCSELGNLTQLNCLAALNRLDYVLERRSVVFPKTDLLIVTSQPEMPKTEDAYINRESGESVLLLRADFTQAFLIAYVSKHGTKNLSLSGGDQ